jgi:hypothetical protein
MKNILLLLTFISFGTAHAQLQISHIDYKVLASAQKDSVVAQSIDSMRIKEPNYMGGSSFLAKKISEIKRRQGCIRRTSLKTGKTSLYLRIIKKRKI